MRDFTVLRNLQARIKLQKEFNTAMHIDDFTAAERLQVFRTNQYCTIHTDRLFSLVEQFLGSNTPA
jgi:hypothetical protein